MNDQQAERTLVVFVGIIMLFVGITMMFVIADTYEPVEGWYSWEYEPGFQCSNPWVDSWTWREPCPEFK